MATRERRLAEFNGAGEPPPDQLVQVLCEDHSGTYQLPFACRWVDGEWRNHESGRHRRGDGGGLAPAPRLIQAQRSRRCTGMAKECERP